MNQQELFTERIALLREYADNNDGNVTIEDVKEAFAEMELDEAGLQMILDFIKKGEESEGSDSSDGEGADGETGQGAEAAGRLEKEDSKYLSLYLQEIAKYPTCTESKKRALFMNAMTGDRIAREELILSLLHQVVDIAKLYTGQGVPLEDLIGEGNVALAMSMEYIRSEKDPKEAEEMVAAMIMRSMEELIEDDGNSRDAFEEWANRANEVLDKAREMYEEVLRKITIEELCEEAEFDPEFVKEVLEVTKGAIDIIEWEKKE